MPDWVTIIKFILWLILQGLSKGEAMERAASRFGVDLEEIKSHMG